MINLLSFPGYLLKDRIDLNEKISTTVVNKMFQVVRFIKNYSMRCMRSRGMDVRGKFGEHEIPLTNRGRGPLCMLQTEFFSLGFMTQAQSAQGP